MVCSTIIEKTHFALEGPSQDASGASIPQGPIQRGPCLESSRPEINQSSHEKPISNNNGRSFMSEKTRFMRKRDARSALRESN